MKNKTWGICYEDINSGDYIFRRAAKKGELSIIRGMASFGDYEIYNGKLDSDPIRFKTAQEVIEELKKRAEKKL